MRKSELVKSLFTAIEQSKFDQAANCVNEDFTFNGPFPKPIKKKEWLTLYKNLMAGIPDLKFNLNNLTESGNVVNGSVQLSGTHTQELPPLLPGTPSVPATNKKIQLPKENVAFTFKNEKISIMTVEKISTAGVVGLLNEVGVPVQIKTW